MSEAPAYGYHSETVETMEPERLRAGQLQGLKRVVEHVHSRSPVQRRRLAEAGVGPQDISGLEDLAKLPTMCKEDLRDNYPLRLSCVDKHSIAEIHTSSGSTGTPVVMPYTNADLGHWGECMARCYMMAGARRGDVLQITPSFGLFNGGFGFYHGARQAGLFVLPTGAGNTARQIRLARDFGTRIITGVVSYGIRIMEVLEEEGGELPDLKIGLFGSETFSDNLKRRLCSSLGIEAFDIYGMTETGGVGTLGMDCQAHDGIHVWEDHYIVEILDSTTHEPVPDGTLGELAVTALKLEALPVIRFRTGDLTRVVSRQRCSCGRSHIRLAPISGRCDDMLIVKGVNFFPRQVEEALMEIPGVRPNYQIILEETDGIRDVRVNVEADPGVTGFTVARHLKERLGFQPKGDVFPPGSLPRQDGKAKRVFRSDEL